MSYEINQPMAVRNKREDREFQQILRHTLPPAGAKAAAGSAIVTRPDGLLPLLLHVKPMTGRGKELSSLRVAALVLIIDPQNVSGIDSDVVRVALHLTRAEAGVAVLLAQGMEVHQIAISTDRKENTIRSHVKIILAKLGLSNQTELVLLVRTLSIARWI